MTSQFPTVNMYYMTMLGDVQPVVIRLLFYGQSNHYVYVSGFRFIDSYAVAKCMKPIQFIGAHRTF